MTKECEQRLKGEEYLAHYGVLGMKWGVRRYQNFDGTLTPAGMKRYGYSDGAIRREMKRQDRIKVSRKLKRDALILDDRFGIVAGAGSAFIGALTSAPMAGIATSAAAVTGGTALAAYGAALGATTLGGYAAAKLVQNKTYERYKKAGL